MTSNAIRFGEVTTILIQGNQTVTETDVIHDFTTAKHYRQYTQSLFGENEKQVLAEVLKLLDKLKDENVTDIAFSCAKKPSNSKYKMEVSYTSK